MPTTPTGFTAFTAAHIQDAAGVLLDAGTLSVVPTDGNDHPITATSGGAGGAIVAPANVAITAGVLPNTFWVPDVALTRPAFISYRITVRDGNGVPIYILKGVQPTGATFNLDTYTPNVPGQATVIVGATGAAGPPLLPRGAYAGGTTYAIGDVVTEGGSSYISRVASNAGNDPVSSPTQWMLLAAVGAPGISGGGVIDFGNATLPEVRNVLDVNKAMVGVLTSSGTVDASFTAYRTSPYMFIGDASHIIANIYLLTNGGGGGPSWYDASKTFLSINALTAPNTPVAVPSGAAYLRISTNGAPFDPTDAVVTGSTLPSPIPAYGFVDAATIAATISTATASLATAIAAKPSSTQNAAMIASSLDVSRNMLDATQVIYNFALDSSGVANSGFAGYQTTPFIFIGDATAIVVNRDIFSNGLGGNIAFYDFAKIFISNIGGSYPKVAGTTFTVPAGAVYMRFGSSGVSPANYATYGVYAGTTLPTVDSEFVSWPNITAAVAASVGVERPHYGPFLGRKMFVTGDSISSGGAWETYAAAVLGTPGTQLYPSNTNRGAYAGGTTYAANDLVYTGGSTGTYWLSLVSSNTGHTPSTSPTFWQNLNLTYNLLGNPGHPMSDAYLAYAANLAANSGGPTIVQQLTTALSDKDLMYIFFGTNDSGTPLGALGDAPVAPGVNTSFYGSLEYAVQTALNAIAATGRSIRLVLITPYKQSRLTSSTSTTLAQVVQAIHDVGKEWGVPVVDLYRDLPINTISWPYYLQSDTVHPTAAGDAILGNFIARQTIPLAIA